jgi:hypothetical protein
LPRLSKQQRLEVFYERLALLPRAASVDEARIQVATTLRAVENEFSGIPDAAHSAEGKGRLYPAEEDNVKKAQSPSAPVVLRSRFHNTYIWANGAIEIRRRQPESAIHPEEMEFEKAGADGRKGRNV